MPRAPRTVSDSLLWFPHGQCWRFAFRNPITNQRQFMNCVPGKFAQAGIALPNPDVVKKRTKVAEDLCRDLQRVFLASLPNLRPETVAAEVPTISKAADSFVLVRDGGDPGYMNTLKTIFAEFEKTVGDKPVERITDEDLKAFERRLARRCGRVTVRAYMKQLFMLINFCVRKGWIRQDPRVTYRLPREEAISPDPYTLDEVKTFVETCRNPPPLADWQHLEWMGVGLLTLGLRSVELIHAKWENVNFDERMLWIDKSHGAKEREARQYQPIPLAVWPLFEERRRKRGPIWTNSDGEQLTRDALASSRRALAKHMPEFRWRRFRKTFATILTESGTDSIVVSRLLRHSAGGRSGTMAGKHYVGQSLRFLRSVVDAAFAPVAAVAEIAPRVLVETAAKVVETKAVGPPPVIAEQSA